MNVFDQGNGSPEAGNNAFFDGTQGGLHPEAVFVTAHETPHGRPDDAPLTPDVMVLRRLVLIESVAHFVRQQCQDEIAAIEAAGGPLDAEQINGMLKAMRDEPADYEVGHLEAMELIAKWRAKHSA